VKIKTVVLGALIVFCNGFLFAQRASNLINVCINPSSSLKQDLNGGFFVESSSVNRSREIPGAISVNRALPSADLFSNSKADILKRIYTLEFSKEVSDVYIDSLNLDTLFFDFAEGVFDIDTTLVPNDYGNTGGNNLNDYALDLIRAQDAWNITTGQDQIKVAVVDTRFDMNHEDFVNADGSSQIVKCEDDDCFNSNLYSSGQNNHGTQVAGVVACATDNNKGHSSIGFNTKLMLYTWRNSSGNISINKAYDSFMKAYSDGARVIVFSGTSGINLTGKTCVEMLYEMGAIIVASSGNGTSTTYGNSLRYPASFDETISVSGIDPLNDNIFRGVDYPQC